MPSVSGRVVCVTGAGGFIASWLVKLLLEKGYTVRGTVRNPGAVHMDPNREPDKVVDETCWSDLDFCKNTQNWYCYGKTVAEQIAWGSGKGERIDLVVLNPMLVLGPLLQPTVNASVVHILKCKDEAKQKVIPYKFTNQKIKNLGMEFMPVKQCLYETVKSPSRKRSPSNSNSNPR
nr:cinnamoyl-CoA reductase 1-like [Ipomoea batatas]